MDRRSLRIGLAALALLSGVLAGAPPSARARPDRPAGEQPRERRARRHTRSIGLPFRGRLEGGIRLRESPRIRYVTEYRESGRFYGTREMIRLLERSAARVWSRLPGSKLSVGELSAERGGRIDGHHSHQNGRDVDISFYMLSARGEPFAPQGFANFDRNGRGIGRNRALRFDDARNWELISRLITDPEARVQHIFVASTLKRRLLREGARRRAPEAVLRRAQMLLAQPAEGHPHRNHFHLRIYCDPSHRPRCRDRGVIHPWYPGRPPGTS